MRAASHHHGNIGENLAATARIILSEARHGLTDVRLSTPEAVHNIRKALKRWRALMRLLKGPFGEEAGRLRIEARDLMRLLAGVRDLQSALDALDDLRKGDRPFSETSLRTIDQRLTHLRDAADEASFTKSIRERLLRYLDFAALSLERWPFETVDFDAVADGLTAAYRRTRQLIPENWMAADAEHLHDLRRRVVEYRHQMDLLKFLRSRRGKQQAEKLQRLRNQLGACQDLAILTGLASPRQPLAAWRARLQPSIEARRTAHLKAAARLCEKLFDEKPKVFRKRIVALKAEHHSAKN